MPKSNGLEDDMDLDLIWPQSAAPVGGHTPATSVMAGARSAGESRLAVLIERVASLEKQVTVLARSVDILTRQLNQIEPRPSTKSANQPRSSDTTARSGGRTARIASPRRASSA